MERPVKPLPPLRLLRKRLRYEPRSGKLFWRERDGDSRHVKRWNATYAGAPAGSANNLGHIRIGIMGGLHMAHRITFALHHGRQPVGEIDHIDHNSGNNRPGNLRECTHAENMRNMRPNARNTSGYNGVNWHKPLGKWRASVVNKGKKIHLGYFDKIEDAVAARAAANHRMGFLANHGVAA